MRKAIGDTGEEQRLVRTISRKGYRFVGEVRDAAGSETQDPARPPDSTARPVAPALALPDRPSIAVLPFLNRSGDPPQDYFVDGVVEDIISALSRISWLFVIARNSSFTYKGKAVDVKQVGRELGVRYVLEGSLRKAANRVRITGQLVDVTGANLLGGAIHALDNIFDLQDQMTANVVGAIAPQFGTRRNRARPSQANGKSRCLRLLFARYVETSIRSQGAGQRGLAVVLQGDPARSGFRVGICNGRVVLFLAQAQLLADRS